MKLKRPEMSEPESVAANHDDACDRDHILQAD